MALILSAVINDTTSEGEQVSLKSLASVFMDDRMALDFNLRGQRGALQSPIFPAGSGSFLRSSGNFSSES